MEPQKASRFFKTAPFKRRLFLAPIPVEPSFKSSAPRPLTVFLVISSDESQSVSQGEREKGGGAKKGTKRTLSCPPDEISWDLFSRGAGLCAQRNEEVLPSVQSSGPFWFGQSFLGLFITSLPSTMGPFLASDVHRSIPPKHTLKRPTRFGSGSGVISRLSMQMCVGEFPALQGGGERIILWGRDARGSTILRPPR